MRRMALSETTDLTGGCECPAEAGSAACELSPPGKVRACPTCGEHGKAVDVCHVIDSDDE